jgi:gamma-glutamylcyclotransferase (GGCT)/AIG2-like uncharacterized protein YtfP
VLYFAYGSNLDPVQFAHRCPGHVVVGLAELRDHQVVFPVPSTGWGGGVASVAVAHGQSVWGVLFEVTEADLRTLDRYEGFRGPGHDSNLYDRETVSVQLVRPDDGSFARRLNALTYIARPVKPTPPSRAYLEAIVRGARHHRLPADYIARLATVATAD